MLAHYGLRTKNDGVVFSGCELDVWNYVLRREGALVKVEPKVFEVLAYLARHRDRFVSREELFTQLWPDNIVSDAALTRCIAEARKAVGDDGTRQQVIRTQYTRGYRCIAELVERVEKTDRARPRVAVTDHSPSSDEPLSECPEAVLRPLSQPLPHWLPALGVLAGLFFVVASVFSRQSVPFLHPPAFVSVEPGTVRHGDPVTGGVLAQRVFVHLKTHFDAYHHTERGWASFLLYSRG